ncbi:hypothetical protein [Thalassotalea sp. SU-HH00458]|uniref:hypothetical protein n=1 Tax=Thalassotalea sp. SU-HH00458 TaxID=3127657 RepID=UPI0031058013
MKLIYKFLSYIYNPFDERHKDIVDGIALALLAMAWLFLVMTTVERIRVFDPVTITRVLSLIGVTAGVYVAVWKLVSDQKWRQSEVYLEQAKELFEKSFDTLKIDKETNYPMNDRYQWLSSARLLLSAQDLGNKIEDKSHKETFNEYVEFWRMKFNDLLDFHGERSPDENYFYEKGKLLVYSRGDREPISEKSIAVIYRFMEWPQNREDRLTTESNFSDIEVEKIFKFGPKGLHDYCSARRKS